MHIELTEAAETVLEQLMMIPPNFLGAEQILSDGRLTAQEVTWIGNMYVEECIWDTDNHYDTEGIIPGLHSTYIYEVVELLLRYGLDPNQEYDEGNILFALECVDNEFLAADTLDLLLQAGGDPALEDDGETFLESLNFDIFFDAVEQYQRQQYASLVHLWMVAIGNSDDFGSVEDRICFFREYDSDTVFDYRKLRNHRNYYFGITHRDNGFEINIYDKETLWEVVRIG